MKITHIVLCLALTLSGCSGFLDVVPKDKQTEKQLYATRAGFFTAVNGVYNNLSSTALYGQRLSFEMIEFLGKRYTYNYSANEFFTALNSFDYTQQEVETALADIWRNAYATILNCNVILDNVEKQNSVLSAADADVIRGEMLAVRAFLHFDMLRLFGPIYSVDPEAESIPYNESGTIKSNPFLPAREVIQDKILRDLDEALELLLASDPVIAEGPLASDQDEDQEGSDIYMRYRQLRFNYYAVGTLKARVQLYGGDKAGALQTAKTLLGDQTMNEHFPPVAPNTLLGNNVNPDRVFSSEVFMGIYKKERWNIYTDYFDPNNAGDSRFIHPRDYLTTDLFAGETQDYRFQSQWEQISAPGKEGHSLIKFKAISKPSTTSDADFFFATLIPMLRRSELYYIAAESESAVGDGYGWLNQIRKLRGLPELPVVSPDDLMKHIRTEYLREFAGEGQVFYLYKRLAVNMPNNENGSTKSTVRPTAANYVPPMPAGELDNR